MNPPRTNETVWFRPIGAGTGWGQPWARCQSRANANAAWHMGYYDSATDTWYSDAGHTFEPAAVMKWRPLGI